MSWEIDYYSKDVENETLTLPASLLARYIRMTELMLKYGPNLGMPHTKAIGSGLFELRLKGKEGLARSFYGLLIGKRIVMLHVIRKKSQKIP